MKPLTHASLFSGIGGFDLAAEWAGWTNLFNCEKDPFCQTVLKYHFPDATQYSDIRDTDFTIWRGRIDVLTGGFPCQPFSHAGKRKGAEDDRYLWPEMLRAISEIRPAWVIGENVGGIVSMVQPGSEIEVDAQATLLGENYTETETVQEFVVETICQDLERIGYSVQPVLIPACGVGAPHRRDRVWFVAYAGGQGGSTNTQRECRKDGQDHEQSKCLYDSRITADRADAGTETMREGTDGVLSNEVTANAECRRGNEVDDQVQSKQSDGTRVDGLGGERTTADTIGIMRNTRRPEPAGQFRQAWTANGRNVDAPDPNSQLSQCRNDKGANGRDQQEIPTQSLSRPRVWQDFPTQPPVCGGDDGLPAGLDGITFPKWRSESIKAYGNAIVPQVAYQIFKAINECERTTG